MRFNRLVSTLLLTGSVGLGMLALGASAARADISVNFHSIVPDVGGFRWNYEVDVTPFQEVVGTGQFPNYFTIYDFNGFVSGSDMAPNADWIFSSSNTGITPGDVLPNDDGSLPNLTWTYTGQTVLTGPQIIGIFSAVSPYSDMSLDNYAGLGTKNVTEPMEDGQPESNIGTTVVPTPEPGTMALLGLGVAPLLRRRRRSRA